MKNKATRMWVAYDERAKFTGTDDCTALSTVDNSENPDINERGVRNLLRLDLGGVAAVVYVYDCDAKGKLTNEEYVFDIE